MFKKLHIQMTLFSTFITGLILFLMTAVCLFIAESGTRQNSYSAFTSNIQSCITHLESQEVISHQWLSQAKSSYGIQMQIKDNQTPLFYDSLHDTEKYKDSFEQAEVISKDIYALDLNNPSSVTALTKSALFSMDGYYAATAMIPKTSGALSVVFLYPLNDLNHQIMMMRISFGAAVLFAVVALAVFSWFFTRKLIIPLEISRQKQTEFIASASHELRSPLAVIRSGLSALEQADPQEAAHFFTVIQKESDRMARLVNDMLSLANADNHSWQICMAPCELDTLLLETYEKYDPAAHEKKLKLKIHLPDDPIPSCTCDSSRISQVLSIFLDNALSYVPPQGTIILSLKKEDQYFILSVSDNGPGISDNAKASVFQRFYREDISRNDKQHFGLGLSIAKEIVNLHHGKIQVSDTPGGGATFLVYLPA